MCVCFESRKSTKTKRERERKFKHPFPYVNTQNMAGGNERKQIVSEWAAQNRLKQSMIARIFSAGALPFFFHSRWNPSSIQINHSQLTANVDKLTIQHFPRCFHVAFFRMVASFKCATALFLKTKEKYFCVPFRRIFYLLKNIRVLTFVCLLILKRVPKINKNTQKKQHNSWWDDINIYTVRFFLYFSLWNIFFSRKSFAKRFLVVVASHPISPVYWAFTLLLFDMELNK